MQVSNNRIACAREVDTRSAASMATTTDQLERIAHAMHQGNSIDARNLNAGYTYLGQFIAHDIVPATTPRPGDLHDPSSALDLDCVYGGPRKPGRLIAGRFEIGPNVAGGPDDLKRDNGLALIPELRNDINVIVSQLHLFMQRFHNLTIDNGFAANVAQARRLVTLVFQLLVVEDYLRQILAPTVFDSYFRRDQRWLGLRAPPAPIPREFAHAGFRFGYSMARPFYVGFPQHQPREVNLVDLFQQRRNLDPALVIDWRSFFGWPGIRDSAQDASRIDPTIARDMSGIRTDQQPLVDIVRANLEAGRAAGLPNGVRYVQQVLARRNGKAIQTALGLAPLRDLSGARELAQAGLAIEDLPLWPYILVEARHASEGQHLGVLGSMICAEVLANAIAAAPYTIYRGRWPSVDEVLSELGPLGEQLQEQRRAAATPGAAFNDRTFCMRHLIEVVLRQPASNPNR